MKPPAMSVVIYFIIGMILLALMYFFIVDNLAQIDTSFIQKLASIVSDMYILIINQIV